MPDFASPPRKDRWNFVLGLALCALAAALYNTVVLHGFSIVDDSFYVTNNQQVLAGFTWENLKNIFLPREGLYWSPLTFFSLMLDAQVFGFWAGGFHLVNLAWHCANIVLFFTLVLRLTGSRPAAVWAAMLLAAHPAHIESVAWITARKDMLSTFFGLAAIHIYISWVRRPSGWRNLLFHSVYVLSLLGKPMFATLAGLLLVLDYWPLGRLRAGESLLPDRALLLARLREKALVIALAGLVTYLTLATHYALVLDRLDPGLGLKLANAVVSYAKYLGLFVWPHDQAMIYPFPESVPGWQVAASSLLLAGLTALGLRQLRARPYLLCGWLWFLGTLVPVIMPPRVGLHVEYADRWAYVPFLGLYLALGLLGAETLERLRGQGRRLAFVAAWVGLPLALLVPQQQRQLATWATPYTQAEQAFRVTRNNYMLHYNYGVLKDGEGDKETAEAAYQKCLEIFPDYGPALNNLGVLRLRQGRCVEALAPLLRAVEASDRHGGAYTPRCSLGVCLVCLGRPNEAQHQFALAIRERPDLPRAYHDWGNLVRDMGDFELARELYAKALAAYPNWDLALKNLAKLEEMAGTRRP